MSHRPAACASDGNTPVAVFCVASPLHYLAARRVADAFEAGTRRVLVCYKPDVVPLVEPSRWDAVVETPWPRMHPLPGPFGRHRRLLDNVHRVAAAVGRAGEIRLHAPVFDTEATNYLLAALPRLCGGARLRARVLPDGLLNVARYPLSRAKRFAQHLRRLRRLVSPALAYTPFAGDRIGSDAPFVDRVYVLGGFPHPYRADRAVAMPSLLDEAAEHAPHPRSALVVGQPLAGVGATDEAGMQRLSAEIAAWLIAEGYDEVFYKAHPRDPRHELRRDGWPLLEIDVPLEQYLATRRFGAIVGVYSTALFLARQVCGAEQRIVAFGADRMRYRSGAVRDELLALMRGLRIEMR